MGGTPQLEIEEHREHHARAWKIKRFGWGAMALVVVAALAGLLGEGPLSKARAHSSGGLQVEYHRILRYKTPSRLTIDFAGGGNDLELSWDVSFLEKIGIEHVEPEPKEYRIDGDVHTWIFARSEIPGRIYVTYHPEVFGAAVARLRVKGLGQLELKQFFLP